MLFGPDGKPSLANEEYKALAGVYRAELRLRDGSGNVSVSVHLALPRSLPGTVSTTGGKVHISEPSKLPGWHPGWSSAWSATRAVCAGEPGDHKLFIALELGNLYLIGCGERTGLRCSHFVGTVFEGLESLKSIGRFSMRLSLPLMTDVRELETIYRRRIAQHLQVPGPLTPAHRAVAPTARPTMSKRARGPSRNHKCSQSQSRL